MSDPLQSSLRAFWSAALGCQTNATSVNLSSAQVRDGVSAAVESLREPSAAQLFRMSGIVPREYIAKIQADHAAKIRAAHVAERGVESARTNGESEIEVTPEMIRAAYALGATLATEAPPRKVNAYGVSTLNTEDFTAWDWGGETALERAVFPVAAPIVVAAIMNEIEVNTMAALDFRGDSVEVSTGLFEFECRLNVSLAELVREWVDQRCGQDGQFQPDENDVTQAKMLEKCLETALVLVRKALGR